MTHVTFFPPPQAPRFGPWLLLLAIALAFAGSCAILLAGCSPTPGPKLVDEIQYVDEQKACVDEAKRLDAGHAYADECRKKNRDRWEHK